MKRRFYRPGLLSVALILALVVSASFGNAADNIIKIRVRDFPPQYFQDTAGNWTGLDVELAKALVEGAGFKAEFLALPWTRALNNLETGDLHMMMNLSMTPERSLYMYWIGPERKSYMALVVSRENVSLSIMSLDDLVTVSDSLKMNFGIQHDFFYSPEFTERMKDSNFARHFEAVSDGALQPRKVKNNRIIGFFEDRTTMAYQIKNSPEYSGLAIHPFVLHEENVYFGVSRKLDIRKLDLLYESYQKLERNGTLEKIRNRVW